MKTTLLPNAKCQSKINGLRYQSAIAYLPESTADRKLLCRACKTNMPQLTLVTVRLPDGSRARLELNAGHLCDEKAWTDGWHTSFGVFMRPIGLDPAISLPRIEAIIEVRWVANNDGDDFHTEWKITLADNDPAGPLGFIEVPSLTEYKLSNACQEFFLCGDDPIICS